MKSAGEVSTIINIFKYPGLVERGGVMLMIDNILTVWAGVKESSWSKVIYSVINAILDITYEMGVRVKLAQCAYS